MKNTILAVLLVAVLLAGCTNQPTPQPYPQKQVFEFEKEFTVNGNTIYTSKDDELKLTTGIVQPKNCMNAKCAYDYPLGTMSLSATAKGNAQSFNLSENARSVLFLNYNIELVSIGENKAEATLKISKRDVLPIQKLFELGKPFTVLENEVYANNENGIVVKVLSFADSRCPAGVQCIWQGELGVNLGLLATDQFGEQWKDNVYLGTVRGREKTFVDYKIELASITEKSATLIITKTGNIPKQKVWFSFDPKQCGTNAWETWEPGKTQDYKNEGYLIRAWLQIEYGIKTYDHASKKVSEIVCMACDCPRGDRIAVLVDSKDANKMSSLGWKSMEPVYCTQDAKICPDGSGIGRIAPFCEFAQCPPGIDLASATISIVKTDMPGFIINPETKTITINNDGSYEIKTSAYNSEEGNESATTKTSKITRKQLEEIAKLALSTNFFSITEEDARSCIADLPTKSLEITINRKSNKIVQLGAECEKEKTKAAYDIVEKIESLIK